MATRGADGSIILSTKVDTNGLKKDLAAISKMAGKAFLAIGASATVATVAITKMAVSAYADYEQLIGGVETLFKDSAGKVVEYARQSFATTGLSANEYMRNVTSFSASLLSSLSYDTEKAADVANMAMIDMSDNANKMGSTMESITNAYQGFAKQQYMLLDNLKLGYGGTKTEMERLLRDAEAYLATQGKSAKLSINNLADVYTAINAIQQKLGIAGTTAKEAETTISGSASMTKAAWQDVLTTIAGGGDLDRAISNLVYSIRKYFENIVPVVERSLIGIGQLIERVAPLLVQNVASSLIQAIPSLLNAVYQMIIGLAKGIWQGITALLSGGTANVTTAIKSNVNGIATAASDATVGMSALGDATEKAGKQAKKSLAGFDDLQVLSSQSASGTDNLNVAAIGGGAGTVSSLLQEDDGMTGGGISPEIAEPIISTLSNILKAASEALLAVGLIVLFSGNIVGGVGLILAGAASYIAGDTLGSDDPIATLQGHLTILEQHVLPALFGIGLLMLFAGQIALGIGLILGGIVYLGIQEVQSQEYDTATFEQKLNVIMEAVSLGLIAIGVLLIFFGQVPLGIGLFIAGKHLLNATEAKLQEGQVTTKIQKFFQDNQGLIVGVGLALVVISLIMFCCGQFTTLALGLLVAGAGVLVSAEAMNEGAITEEISNFFKENTALFAGIGIALVLLGIILLFTGVGLPLAIGLLVAGGASLAAAIAPNWNFITDKVKEVWDSISQFWQNNIAPWFTIEKWKELASNIWTGIKNALSGLAEWFGNIFSSAWNAVLGVFSATGEVFKGIAEGVFEVFKTVVNFLIDGINTVVKLPFEGLNNILDRLHGIEIAKIKPFSWLTWRAPVPQIPHLARGAVIPPNREFLAVLGDQKSGTNIEAPAELIKQMAKEAIAESGFNGQATREEHYYLDETELMSIVYRLVKGGERLKGDSLVGGAY